MIVVAGVDHRSAPLALRERLAAWPGAEALARAPFDETLVLSTCNRFEVYAVADDPARVAGRLPGVAAGCLRVATDLDAAEHAFRVACGLESAVLGEPQILTQVREASKAARAAGTLGPVLTALFQRSIDVGRRARTQTGIASCAPSMVEAGLAIARDALGGLAGRTVLVVGAGKMSDLATSLVAREDAQILIANRTRARADTLARRIAGARAVELRDGLARADVIVSCTSSLEPVITAGMLDRDVFVLDLAVPRDVEPGARAHIVTIDDLVGVVRPDGRAADEIAKVERLVADQVDRFDRWLRARAARAA